MNDSVGEDEIQSNVADILMKFLNTFPLEDRKLITNSLVKLRERLTDVISNTNPIGPYLTQIKQLRHSFLRIPLFLRKNLKSILLDGLEASVSGPSVSLSIFTICLCLIEFSALRNSDRSDLEGENILDTIVQLKVRVIPNLTQRVLDQRTNLPSLLSWSLCMLVFTFRACLEWLTLQNYPIPSECNVRLPKRVRKHPSVPLLMQCVLESQSKRRPYFIPAAPHSFLDMVLANATTNNTGHLNSSRMVKYDASKCPLELDEPLVRPIKLKTPLEAANQDETESLTSLPESFGHSLETGSLDEVCSNLKLLRRLSFEAPDIHKSVLLDNFILTLQSTPFILIRLKDPFLRTKSDKDVKKLIKFEEVYCLLLKLWIYALEKRVLLKHLSQSYVWLAAFTYPNYEIMTLNGFVEIVLWTARFLTAYQSCFRSAILASPHWFLQMITDVVVELINRSEKCSVQGVSDDEVEDALVTCIIAISRPFSALHTDEPSIRIELSRAIKTPIESILARMATCRSTSDSNTDPKKPPPGGGDSSSEQSQTNRPAISPKVRELLLNHLLIPMLRIVDPWALGQARLGMRPAAAKVLLKQILITAENLEASWEGVQVSSRLELPKANPAVGGLHIAEKLSLKRRR